MARGSFTAEKAVSPMARGAVVKRDAAAELIYALEWARDQEDRLVQLAKRCGFTITESSIRLPSTTQHNIMVMVAGEEP